MTKNIAEPGSRRLVPVIKLPADPSRHRVAVWRELRRIGALPLGQGIWAVRSEDWTACLADCGTLEAEIAKEIRIAKFTSAELEEEEQSLERLRRRHRDLTDRHVFGAPEAAEDAARLKQCVTVCDDYAEQVFRALHETKDQDR